jgi:hypothetical protein
MQKTYPETTRFRWEGDTPYLVTQAVEFLTDMAAQGGSKPRQAALKAAAAALMEISDRMDRPHFTGNQMKKILIAAAQDQGWWERKHRAMPSMVAAPGMKVCFRCAQTKSVKDFETRPTPAKARAYGWKEDTTMKVVGPLCGTCRKAKADAEGRKRQRRYSRKKLDTLSPAAAMRFKHYHSLKQDIADHMARVRAAYSNVRHVIPDPLGNGEDVIEYQFESAEVNEFYKMKRLLLIDARDRLEQRFADAAPLPDTWGMLLTRDEQLMLSNLHTEASMYKHRNIPSLWTAKPRTREIARSADDE